MRKHANRIPPALKHGIYSGLGLLPTESRAKFRKFRKQRFAELALTGALEQDIGEEIIRLEWRRNNLFTYDLAERARYQYNMIYAPLSFSAGDLRAVLADEPKPRSRSPEELAALSKTAARRVRTELGAAIELVNIGDVATIEHLEKQFPIRERLDVMITRAYKKLAYVRAIKSMSPSAVAAPSPPRLEKAA